MSVQTLCRFGLSCNDQDNCSRLHRAVCRYALENKCKWNPRPEHPCKNGEHPSVLPDGNFKLTDGTLFRSFQNNQNNDMKQAHCNTPASSHVSDSRDVDDLPSRTKTPYQTPLQKKTGGIDYKAIKKEARAAKREKRLAEKKEKQERQLAEKKAARNKDKYNKETRPSKFGKVKAGNAEDFKLDQYFKLDQDFKLDQNDLNAVIRDVMAGDALVMEKLQQRKTLANQKLRELKQYQDKFLLEMEEYQKQVLNDLLERENQLMTDIRVIENAARMADSMQKNMANNEVSNEVNEVV